MHQILFGVFSLLVLSVHSWEYKVIVDQKLNATNDSCNQDSNNTLKCVTINSALKNLKYNSTVIKIKPGNYNLTNGEETDITGKQDIAIIGSGEDSIITCTEHTGLGVLNSVNITIKKIVMKGCGKKYTIFFLSKSRKHTYFVNVHASLYFKKYDNITLHSVVILDYKGAGLHLHGDECDFQSNFIMKNSMIVNASVVKFNRNSIAGGIVINANGSGTIRLRNSSIINNDETQIRDVYCSPIGAVAGIVVLELPAKLIIDSCNITNNTRGIVVYDESAETQVSISNSVLMNHFTDCGVVLKKQTNDSYNVNVS